MEVATKKMARGVTRRGAVTAPQNNSLGNAEPVITHLGPIYIQDLEIIHASPPHRLVDMTKQARKHPGAS